MALPYCKISLKGVRITLVEQLVHSKHLKAVFWVAVGVLFVVELLLFRLAFTNYEDVGMAQSLWAFFISSTLPLGVFLRLMIKVRPVVFAKYSLYDDQLDVSSGRKHMVIKFEDLYSIKFGVGWSRFFRGYQLHHQSGQRIRIFSTLNHSDLILEQIQKNRPRFIEPEQLESYKKQIQLNKISWKRLWELKARFKTTSVNVFLVPLAFASLTWFTAAPTTILGFDFKWIDWFLGLLLGHFIVLMVLNSLEEKLVYTLYAKTILNADFERNLELEKKLRWTFIGIYWLLSLTLAVLLSR